MTILKGLVVSNFKRFSKLSLKLDSQRNILIGDNEAGKSSVLLAIDLVLSGSRSKVESIGLETLFHKACIDEFFAGPKTMERLPKLFIEAYLPDEGIHGLAGKINSKKGFYAQIHENFRMRFSSPFQQLLTILAQHAIRPKMPVKGLPRDSQLLA